MRACVLCVFVCNMKKTAAKINEEKAEWKTGSTGYFEFLL